MLMPDLPAFAVVGPGRAGSALARRWRESGAECFGFLGRSARSPAIAVEFVGGGRVLERSELLGFLERPDPGVVLLAVQDDRLAEMVATLALDLRGDGLVIHCSGPSDLTVLQPLRAAGFRVGSLHPLTPIPDATVGYANLPGQPAVIEVQPGDDVSRATLQGLAVAAGMVPVVTTGGDRLIYHAACVLAANGLTALFSLVQALFTRSLERNDEPPADDAMGSLTGALMGSALAVCLQHGPVTGMSGPVVRGDAELIRRQLDALSALEPGGTEAADVYRLLLRRAVAMTAGRRSPGGPARAAIEAVLERHG